ncbi:MAG: hypothetical protein WC052_02975 [Patescibacteria group bacterium]
MKLEIGKKPTPTLVVRPLGQLKPGDCFRYHDGECLETLLLDENPAVFMVVPGTPADADRVTVFPLDGRSGVSKKDSDRKVVLVEATVVLRDARR